MVDAAFGWAVRARTLSRSHCLRLLVCDIVDGGVHCLGRCPHVVRLDAISSRSDHWRRDQRASAVTPTRTRRGRSFPSPARLGRRCLMRNHCGFPDFARPGRGGRASNMAASFRRAARNFNFPARILPRSIVERSQYLLSRPPHHVVPRSLDIHSCPPSWFRHSEKRPRPSGGGLRLGFDRQPLISFVPLSVPPLSSPG